MAKAENRPIEWVESPKGSYPVTHECPFCGIPRDEMRYNSLPGHLPHCEEAPL